MTEENERKIQKQASELEVLYRLFNWKWYDQNWYFPTADQIEQEIYNLIEDLEDEPITGRGLKVTHEGKGLLSITWNLDKTTYIGV